MNLTVEKLLEPVSIGSLKLKNRIGMPPMTMCYTNENDGVSQQHLNYFRERAAGGAGMIIVGGVTVDGEMGKLFCPAPLLRLDDNKYVAGFNRLVETIHDQGAKAVIQLYNAGRQTTPEKTGGKSPLSASDCSTKLMGMLPMPDARAMTVEEIVQLEDAYAESALRAKTAGFDAILIDGGAGYCIAQFMSSYTNKRSDHYGGSLEERMRLPLNIIRKIKEQVGEDFPLFFDLPVDELVEGGIRIEESIVMAQMLENAGIQAFRIHVGVYETYQYVVPPAAVPNGVHADLSKELKQNLNYAKVMLGHRINDPAFAEKLLQQGAADVILLGRALIADPEFPKKTAYGQFEDIRRCIACNTGCAARIVKGVPATCAVNPAAGKEEEYRIVPARHSQKVLVAGGGVSGMEAARVCALRGHRVTLYEKNDSLGGQANLAAVPPNKGEILHLVSWLEGQIKKLGVDIRLSMKINYQDIVEKNPDAVIVATGAVPVELSNVDSQDLVSSWAVLSGKKETGKSVIVVGGGQVGLETADYLASHGKEVKVLEMLSEVGKDMELFSKVFLLSCLGSMEVEMITNAKVENISEKGVYTSEKFYPADTVVLALGHESCSELATELESVNCELYMTGDCVQPRNLQSAIYEGNRAGRMI